MTQEQATTQDQTTTDWKAKYEAERVRIAKLWTAFQAAEARVQQLEQGIAATEAASEQDQLQPAARYPVATYLVEEIPGVGPVNKGKLSDVGINLTDTLLHADLDRVATATDIPAKRLQRWRNIAELMSLKGVGPRLAEHLVDAGITSIQQVAKHSAKELESVLTKQIETNGRASEDAEVLRRTLPSRCKRIAATAKEAAKDL